MPTRLVLFVLRRADVKSHPVNYRLSHASHQRIPCGSISGRVGQGRDDAVIPLRDPEACCSGASQRQRGVFLQTHDKLERAQTLVHVLC